VRTLEEVKGRCFVTDDGHWLWRGGLRPDGRANIYAPDYSTGNADMVMSTQAGPRAVWHLHTGKPIPKGHRAYVVCPHANCCNPECIRCTDGHLQGLNARRTGRFKNSARHLAARRAISISRAVLSADQVEYVKASNKTGLELAAELGVSKSSVSKYRRGEHVVTASGLVFNPFAALAR
jgi:DNA-binding transcriptional regulator YdaS (Cro superfamily)